MCIVYGSIVNIYSAEITSTDIVFKKKKCITWFNLFINSQVGPKFIKRYCFDFDIFYT